MTRVRRLLLGLASSSAFYSGLVPALGLGEITLHSALNQPLEAEIELLEVGDLGASDLLVRLAPAEVFNRSGVDRLVFLNDLRFTPLLRGGGSVIRVVSNQAVREPYLNFIVEVVRPNGRLLREYTVLLDPPGSSAYRSVAVLPAAAPRALPAEAQTPATAAPALPAIQPLAELGRRYRVTSGDSLWTIAARLRADGGAASQQRLMGDIHALNPRAFVNGDRNRLLAGVELLLPDVAVPARDATPSEVAAEAVAEVQAPAPVEPPFDPQAEQIEQVQRRVDQELAAQAAENLQLQQGLADLQEQLQQLQEQMDSKDQQLAVLQAQLSERQVSGESLGAPALPAVEAPAAVAQDAPPNVQGRSWFGVAGAALLLLLLGLVGLFWRSQRRRAAPEAARQDAPEPVLEVSEPPAQSREAAIPVRVETIPAATPMMRPATPSDALEGANIYIAYGRFSEAAATLRKALDSQPQRSDIRFRLLEVLGQLGDAPAFAAQEAILRDSGFSAARIDQLKARYPGLASAAPAGLLDDAVLALDEVAAQAVEPADDFQLNLDDLSLDADWDLVTPLTPVAPKKSAAAPVSDIGSNLSDLPDVEELAGDDTGSPFAGTMLVEEASAEAWLQDELDQAFVDQPPAVGSALFSDLDQLAGSSDNLAKLNLALAYIEQGSLESACGILNEVISDGDDEEKQQARELLAMIA